MRRIVAIAATAAAAAVLTIGVSAPASAAQGQVTVFSSELTPLDTYVNPSGCYKLPIAAHVLTNQTDSPVHVYADPFCVTPSLTVNPGYGSHVAAGSGSFSA
ncbi:hypothetical protein [Actinocatenispora rupis]|uniref:Uncharacterized protein n=1 Tax=Actinocatenispora rupis TaxID=519421 RepID=A0A8J3J6C4_9ACTN|nr:hypothetical protein [Actinocatenispora rupis]GID11022.1 hypothetical protein Aru02nite_19110 [Actinocatenispora rupis]